MFGNEKKIWNKSKLCRVEKIFIFFSQMSRRFSKQFTCSTCHYVFHSRAQRDDHTRQKNCLVDMSIDCTSSDSDSSSKNQTDRSTVFPRISNTEYPLLYSSVVKGTKTDAISISRRFSKQFTCSTCHHVFHSRTQRDDHIRQPNCLVSMSLDCKSSDCDSSSMDQIDRKTELNSEKNPVFSYLETGTKIETIYPPQKVVSPLPHLGIENVLLLKRKLSSDSGTGSVSSDFSAKPVLKKVSFAKNTRATLPSGGFLKVETNLKLRQGRQI